MKSSIARLFLLGVLAVLTLGLAAQADTLALTNGQRIQGKFLGGSSDEIQFQVNGQFKVYKRADVSWVSFGDAAGPASGSAPAASSAMSSAPPTQTVTIPAGTSLLVRMIDGIDSSTNKVGDIFHASLEDNLVVGEVVVAPKGADVYGRLAESKSAGHIAGKSELTLELTGIRINGNIQPVVSETYSVAGKSRGKQSAERIGGGAAIGAIIGAIAGGGKGAAIGAGVGAGAGTAVQVITHGEQVRVPSETLLSFRTEQPLTVSIPTSSSH